jgi:23S rRNA U2552 (ribose-2'-O)-methylase RlmE/FtsJ
MLNFKAIDMLSTHPRDMDRSFKGCQLAMDMLSSGLWNYRNVPTKVYPMDKFDDAHKELETKFGKYLKAVIDMNPDHIGAEPYIVE